MTGVAEQPQAPLAPVHQTRRRMPHPSDSSRRRCRPRSTFRSSSGANGLRASGTPSTGPSESMTGFQTVAQSRAGLKRNSMSIRMGPGIGFVGTALAQDSLTCSFHPRVRSRTPSFEPSCPVADWHGPALRALHPPSRSRCAASRRTRRRTSQPPSDARREEVVIEVPPPATNDLQGGRPTASLSARCSSSRAKDRSTSSRYAVNPDLVSMTLRVPTLEHRLQFQRRRHLRALQT